LHHLLLLLVADRQLSAHPLPPLLLLTDRLGLACRLRCQSWCRQQQVRLALPG
jgi:hypothetical protein